MKKLILICTLAAIAAWGCKDGDTILTLPSEPEYFIRVKTPQNGDTLRIAADTLMRPDRCWQIHECIDVGVEGNLWGGIASAKLHVQCRTSEGASTGDFGSLLSIFPVADEFLFDLCPASENYTIFEDTLYLSLRVTGIAGNGVEWGSQQIGCVFIAVTSF